VSRTAGVQEPKSGEFDAKSREELNDFDFVDLMMESGDVKVREMVRRVLFFVPGVGGRLVISRTVIYWKNGRR
jgi:hypothetical protein